MCSKTTLSGANKPLSVVVTAILAFSLLLSIPGNPGACAGETEELYFSILHTNDMHSEVIPHSPAVDYLPREEDPSVGGFARLATVVDEIREDKKGEAEPVLLFDAGDFLGGAPFAWLALDGHAAELTLMQEMGYDAVNIGNHEYDYTADVLAQYLLEAGYPEAHEETLVLASNTEAPSDHPLAASHLYRDTGLFELENGLKVGVFGIVGEDAILSMGDADDMLFLDQQETARRMVDELTEQGADVIVAISHSGEDDDRELAREVPGIDVIVGGHTHTALFEPIRQGATIIVQAGALGKYLGRLELAYSPSTGGVRVRNEENGHSFLIPIDSGFAGQPEIEARVGEYTVILSAYIEALTEGAFDDVMSTVARSDFDLSNLPSLSETPLGNFVTDAMRFVAQNFTGRRVDIAGQAEGNIRNSIFRGTRPYSAGNISFYDVAEATSVGRGLDGYPGTPMASVYFTGEEMRRVLETTVLLQEVMGDSYFLHLSGLRYSYNPANAVLFTVPVVDLPIPTTRAVASAELYTGDGVQPAGSPEYVPLKQGDDELYHLVTDGYLLLFLPLVADLLPQLTLVPKNAEGEPVPLDSLDELIIRHQDGRELKVWEAVMMYAAAQAAGEDGVPQIPDYYRGVAGRVTRVWTFPLLGWLLLILAAIVAGIVYLVIRRRKHRASRNAVPIRPAENQ